MSNGLTKMAETAAKEKVGISCVPNQTFLKVFLKCSILALRKETAVGASQGSAP